MAGFVNKFVIGASVLVGMSAVGVAPAQAQFKFENIGGAQDVKLYNSDGTNTYEDPTAKVEDLLKTGDNNPGGNVELFATSESVSLTQYFFGPQEATSIEGTYKGQSLTISSLTATDWFGDNLDISYGADNFANQYFNAFFDAAINDAWKPVASLYKENIYNAFGNANLFQAASDPNISYITDNGEDLMVGLAGYSNLWQKDGLEMAVQALTNSMLGLGVYDVFNETIQFSEAVKVNYGGVEKLLFGDFATDSNLVSDDETNSHTGNYEVTVGSLIEPPASVPEPSTMLGLMAVGGLFAAAKRNAKKA
ncbi:MAG: NF038130 family PEP-CTERM protein [Cyanobacteria bacterium J06592_8]